MNNFRESMCPKCNTENISIERVYGTYRCSKCSYIFTIMPYKDKNGKEVIKDGYVGITAHGTYTSDGSFVGP